MTTRWLFLLDKTNKIWSADPTPAREPRAHMTHGPSPRFEFDFGPGGWKLPPDVEQRFEVPPGVVFYARWHGSILVVWPSKPLIEKRINMLPHFNEPQRRVLELLYQGLTIKQISWRMRRRPRWVCYRIAEIKHGMGVTTREQVMAHLRSCGIHPFTRPDE